MARKKSRRAPKTKAPPFPKSVEKRYLAYLRRRVKALDKLVRKHVLKSLATGKKGPKVEIPGDVRADGIVEDVIAALERLWNTQVKPDEGLLDRLVSQVSDNASAFHGRLFFDAPDLPPAKLVAGVVPIPTPFSTKKFVADNVGLIKSIDAVYFDRVRDIVSTAQERGWSEVRAGRALQDATGITERRAQLIARDQIATVNSKVAEKQQTDAGLESYTWSTSLDEVVRPEHAAREGVEFRWADPPPDGHPGEPINCRCVAIPVF